MKKYALLGLLALVVAPAAFGQCLLTYQTEAVDAFFVNQPGNFQLIAVSGTEPYRFEIHSGVLPEGLHLTSSGRIVGVPRQEEEQVVLITVTDAEGCHLTQAFNIVVFP
jgi:Putative Ig domain